MLPCDCGNKTNAIRYKNGKKTCSKCVKMNLSGEFLRNLEGEARAYAADILQPNNPNFASVYGKGRNIIKEKKAK